MTFRGRPLPARAGAVPARLGVGVAGHDPGRPAGEGERALPGLRGRARRGHRRLDDPAPGPGRGLPAAAEALRAPVRRARPPDVIARLQAAGRPQHRPLRPARRHPTQDTDAPGDDMDKPFAITLDVGSSRANKTGSWRTERAVYVERLPPCNHACPAGEDIQSWLYDAEEGGAGYERAWRTIMATNPFPAVMGRVCYHPCETACNRGILDEAVGINSVERFLGDEAIRQGWTVDGRRTAHRQAGPGRRRRSGRPRGGVPPGPARARGDGPRRRAEAGRDDAVRHPGVPPAPRRPGRGDPADPRPRRRAGPRRPRHRPRAR